MGSHLLGRALVQTAAPAIFPTFQYPDRGRPTARLFHLPSNRERELLPRFSPVQIVARLLFFKFRSLILPVFQWHIFENRSRDTTYVLFGRLWRINTISSREIADESCRRFKKLVRSSDQEYRQEPTWFLRRSLPDNKEHAIWMSSIEKANYSWSWKPVCKVSRLENRGSLVEK